MLEPGLCLAYLVSHKYITVAVQMKSFMIFLLLHLVPPCLLTPGYYSDFASGKSKSKGEFEIRTLTGNSEIQAYSGAHH